MRIMQLTWRTRDGAHVITGRRNLDHEDAVVLAWRLVRWVPQQVERAMRLKGAA